MKVSRYFGEEGWRVDGTRYLPAHWADDATVKWDIICRDLDTCPKTSKDKRSGHAAYVLLDDSLVVSRAEIYQRRVVEPGFQHDTTLLCVLAAILSAEDRRGGSGAGRPGRSRCAGFRNSS